MKKAIFFVSNAYNNRKDQYMSCRAEGRILMNIGFGFSLLGYESFIHLPYFEGIKEVYSNVTLCQTMLDYHYDLAVVWVQPHFLNCKCDRVLFFGYGPDHYEFAKQNFDKFGKDRMFMVSPFKKNVDYLTQKSGAQIRYFPPIYPIPSYLPAESPQGFVPFNYKPALPEIKVYMFSTSWHPPAYPGDVKSQRFLELLKSKGYRVKLYLHVNSIENSGVLNANALKGDETIYLVNSETTYLDLLNVISSVDICVTKGGWGSGGNCAWDIISLGKPLLFIAHGKDYVSTINDFYDCPEDLIWCTESDAVSINKFESFLSNPEAAYNRYKEKLKEHDFPVWKDYVTNFLEGG